MNLEKIIEEVYDRGPQQYGAYSSAPRKDFVPLSTKDGYNYPNQQNQPLNNLTTPPPQAPISYPWPLQTIVDDLSDSFICLLNAANKMSDCVKGNPTLSDEQKKEIFEFYRSSKKALDIIKKIGLDIGNVANIAGDQPSQNPVYQPPAPKNETLPDTGNILKIKLP
jgi:hypothetical protein